MESNALRSLLDRPLAAALVTYRADGSADVPPVWYRATDSAIEVVIAEDDPKLRFINNDDRVVLTVFETVHPFRGVKVSARVIPDRDATAVQEARDEIAPRYLGEARGAVFAANRAREPSSAFRCRKREPGTYRAACPDLCHGRSATSPPPASMVRGRNDRGSSDDRTGSRRIRRGGDTSRPDSLLGSAGDGAGFFFPTTQSGPAQMAAL